jgi:hypothetical protein
MHHNACEHEIAQEVIYKAGVFHKVGLLEKIIFCSISYVMIIRKFFHCIVC